MSNDTVPDNTEGTEAPGDREKNKPDIEPGHYGNCIAPKGQEDGLDSTGNVVSEYSPPSTPGQEERKPLRVDFMNDEYNDCNMENKRENIEKDLKKMSRRGTGSIRYAQPRMSLLGKPLSYRMHKQDIRVRRIQTRIYNFLERPKIWPAVLYHLFM